MKTSSAHEHLSVLCKHFFLCIRHAFFFPLVFSAPLFHDSCVLPPCLVVCRTDLKAFCLQRFRSFFFFLSSLSLWLLFCINDPQSDVSSGQEQRGVCLQTGHNIIPFLYIKKYKIYFTKQLQFPSVRFETSI